MSEIKHSVEEERVIKKAKVMYNGNEQVPVKEVEVFVSGDAKIEKLPVLEVEKKKKRKRGSRKNLKVVEEGKEIYVQHEPNERKTEVSALSLAENTTVDSIKEVDVVVSGDANIEKLPVVDVEKKKKKKRRSKASVSEEKLMVVEEGKDGCVQLESNERKIEISALSLAANTNVDSIKEVDGFVSVDANVEKLPVLEVEKKKKRKRGSSKKLKVVEEGKEIYVEHEPNERKTEVSALRLPENTIVDSIKEVDVVVSGDANIEKLQVVDVNKKKKRRSKASVSEKKPMVVEEGKESCVELESNERKIEDSGLSLAKNTNVDSIKEVDGSVSGVSNIEKLPVLEVEKKKKRKKRSKASVLEKKPMVVEEGKETCAELESHERKTEVSGQSLAENTNIDSAKEVDVVVSGDANIEKLPKLEAEKKKKRKRRAKESVSEKKPMVDEEGKEICAELESNERKSEVSGLSLAENTNIDSIKEVDVVVSGDANIEKLPVLELKKKKKLLVLDLNGLLADLVVPWTTKHKADINIGQKALFKRPFCEDFLKFCFDKFEVGIWSSRARINVEKIAEFLMGDMKNKLLFCWDTSHCIATSFGSLEKKNKNVMFKNLNRLWDKYDPDLPWIKGDYNATNTVLIDDSPYKALLNPPYTAIFPQSYCHHNRTDTSLGSDGDLRLYLEKLAEAENVQDFIKNNPFGQESIMEGSKTWEFYGEAIHTAKTRKMKPFKKR